MKFSNLLKSALPATILGFAVLGLASLPALAATATGTINVNATIQATCLITTGPLAFGTYTGVIAQSTSTISVTCTNTTPYHIELNPGSTTGATVTTRQMTGPGGALLNYGLFSDAGYSVNWGQTDGTDDLSEAGTGSAQTFTVYGQVPAGQYLAPGYYSDNVTATINY